MSIKVGAEDEAIVISNVQTTINAIQTMIYSTKLFNDKVTGSKHKKLEPQMH